MELIKEIEKEQLKDNYEMVDALTIISGGSREITKSRDELIDVVENIIANQPQIDCPVIHRFTPNMYIREVSVPANTILTSQIHRKEHPHVLSKGTITIWDGEGGEITISAPYCGITKENTRRVVLVHEDCVFTTFHVTDKTTVEEVEEDIFVDYENNLFDEETKKSLKNSYKIK
jgi:hypothetical protein